MALFESYERREKQILAVLEQYGIKTIEECADVCKEKGLVKSEGKEYVMKDGDIVEFRFNV